MPDLLIKTLAGLSNVSLFGTGYITDLRDLAALSCVCLRTYQMLLHDANLAIIRGQWLRYKEREVWKPFGEAPDTFCKYLCLEGLDLRSTARAGAAYLFRYYLELVQHDLLRYWYDASNPKLIVAPQLRSVEQMVKLICNEASVIGASQMVRQLCAFFDGSRSTQMSVCHRLLDVAYGIARSSPPHKSALFDCLVECWYKPFHCASAVGDFAAAVTAAAAFAESRRVLYGPARRLDGPTVQKTSFERLAKGAHLDARWYLAVTVSGSPPDLYDWLSYRAVYYHLAFKAELGFHYVNAVFSHGCVGGGGDRVSLVHALGVLAAIVYPSSAPVASFIPRAEWERMMEAARFGNLLANSARTTYPRGIDSEEAIRTVTLFKIYVTTLFRSSGPETLEWLLTYIGSAKFARDAFFEMLGRGIAKYQLKWLKCAEKMGKIDYADEETRNQISEILSAHMQQEDDDEEDEENEQDSVRWYVRDKMAEAMHRRITVPQ